MNPTRLLIADDHVMVLEGVSALLAAHGPEWEICGMAADAAEAVAQAIGLQPDIVIMDYKMGIVDGLTAAGQIKERVPSAEVLIFSGAIAPSDVREIYRSSVCGYVLKTESFEELIAALEALRRHDRFRSRRVTELYVQVTESASVIETLSVRELETLRMIAQSKSSKEIAAHMGISVKTVESHRSNLFRKLECSSVVDLTRYALRNGLADL